MKTILRLIFFFFVFIIFFIGYLTFVGLETDRFNNQIRKKIKDIDQNLELELKEIKLIFDPFNLSINAKTIGPKIKAKNKIINLEYIQTRLSLGSLINNKFSLENLKISSKSLKIKDTISFIRIFTFSKIFSYVSPEITN